MSENRELAVHGVLDGVTRATPPPLAASAVADSAAAPAVIPLTGRPLASCISCFLRVPALRLEIVSGNSTYNPMYDEK